ncbi:MAG: sigma-54 dependent transcriptional regulator [Acidobacteriota bacterium]|nr:sigma-54 dependent transcriptional regulator [Acidobacteriota bacterium]
MAATQRILICDDEPAIRKTLAEILEDEDYQVETVPNGESLIKALHRSDSRVDAILLDVWLPGMDGVETLKQIRELGYQTPVIVISGHATLDAAVQATKHGAFDFLEKPLNLDKVVLTLANALEKKRLEKRFAGLEAQLPTVQMVGSGPAIAALKEDIEMAAPSKGRVLILGESGSGKELAARLIHERSNRAAGPFVEMNCAAIPEELIESEMFGHVKGSFTGAQANRAGKFELADGGTLFLDEIADMSLSTQAKVLRVLQEQRFQPIGSGKTIHVDVRVIAATNKELEAEIAAGRFREDLYFRLNVIPLRMPPLRERAEDLPELCAHFTGEFSRAYGREQPRFTDEAMQCLQSYRWPGNVRELRNIMERLVIMSRSPEIDVARLPEQVRGRRRDGFSFRNYDSLKEAREDFERRYIEFQLKRHEGNITKTAEALKLERSNLHKKIKAYGIENE